MRMRPMSLFESGTSDGSISLADLLAGNTVSGESMLIAKALSLAAVEVLEGAARPLKREKRRRERDFPGHPRMRAFIARRWFDRHATHARKIVAAAQRDRD
jgi:hypothetical protein